MVARYSDCHFAEVMPNSYAVNDHGARCSFCGEPCELVDMPLALGHDLELTLRRWKDGDCTLDDMFDRVNKELERSWLQAFRAAAKTLQGNKLPKYELLPGNFDWTGRKS